MYQLTRHRPHAGAAIGQPAAASQRAAVRKGSWHMVRRNLSRLCMAAPGVVWIVVFSYIPLFGLVIAFKDFRASLGILGSQWVGFRNFYYLFATQTARQITYNTLLMNGLFIVTTLVAALTAALLMYRIRRHLMARFYQSALFFPYFISWVIVAVFIYALLSTDDGLVNRLLLSLGLDKVHWYESPRYWPAILTLVNLWKTVGFWSIVYFAGILGISPEVFEAAEVDGATGWQQTVYVTLPLLLPLVTINVLLSIGRIFYADFGLFYQVTRDSGLLYRTTNVIDTYVYRSLVTTGDVGMASAAGLYQAVVGFLLVFLSNWLVRRLDPDRSLF